MMRSFYQPSGLTVNGEKQRKRMANMNRIDSGVSGYDHDPSGSGRKENGKMQDKIHKIAKMFLNYGRLRFESLPMGEKWKSVHKMHKKRSNLAEDAVSISKNKNVQKGP